jgi:hypothetical protein
VAHLLAWLAEANLEWFVQDGQNRLPLVAVALWPRVSSAANSAYSSRKTRGRISFETLNEAAGAAADGQPDDP